MIKTSGKDVSRENGQSAILYRKAFVASAKAATIAKDSFGCNCLEMAVSRLLQTTVFLQRTKSRRRERWAPKGLD
jgi:hypothetical protein